MSQKNNFYIAYATLMAGLFFIFLFIFAALLFKNVFSAREFSKEQSNLLEQRQRLDAQIKDFKEEQALIYELAKKELENNSSKNSDNEAFQNNSKNELILLSRLDKKEQELSEFKKEFEKIKDDFRAARIKQDEFLLSLQAKADANLSLENENLVLLSENFFEKDSFFLKNEEKNKLKEILQGYFDFILNDKELLSKLESLNINIHTDDRGSSAYKLELAAKRVNELSNFIYSFNKDKKLWQLLSISPKGAAGEDSIELKLVFSNEILLQSLDKLVNHLQ